jgi:FtsZ-binding cell division protein ZapB
LERGLGRDKARYILHDKPRREKQKSLTDNLATNRQNDYNNLPNIPAPDYNIVVPDQVVDEVINEQEPKQEESDYEVEELKQRIDTLQNNLDQAMTDKKDLEEKYRQLQAKTRVSTNNIPAVLGKTLRIKVVVSDVFREVLRPKGAKIIYANVVIDASQNRYIRLEPL